MTIKYSGKSKKANDQRAKLENHLMNVKIGVDYCLWDLENHDYKNLNKNLEMLNDILEYEWGELRIKIQKDDDGFNTDLFT